MKVEAKMNKITKEGKRKAIGSVVIEDAVRINDITVVEGASGLFVAFPQRKGADDKYVDIAHPITKEARETIVNAVMEAYNKL